MCVIRCALLVGYRSLPAVGLGDEAHQMDIYARIAVHYDEIVRLAAVHGAHNVRVFGSVARREADEHSDIDLLVDLDPGRTLMDIAALWLDLQDLLGCSVDLVTDGGLKGAFRDAVLSEAVLLAEIAA